MHYEHGTGILLLITNEFSTEGLRAVALVRSECFENQILCISTRNVMTTRVIIYFIDVIDSLGNRIYIFIEYKPLLRILGGEIYLSKM